MRLVGWLVVILSCCAIQLPSIAGEIAGTVFDTDGKTPKAGATVLLSSSDEPLRVRFNLPRTTTTDDNGRFKFGGLISGAYTVRALHEVDGTMATSQTRLPNDESRVGVWLTLRQMRSQDGAMIWGVVKTDKGEVVIDAQVFYRKVGDREWERTQVDEFGMYFVRGLSPGEYEVAALAGAITRIPDPLRRLLTTSLKPQTVTLQDGAILRLDLIAVQMGQLALGGVGGLKRNALNLQVSGLLVDEDGNPLAETPFRVTGTQIRLRGKGGNQFAMMAAFNLPSKTDREGKFNVTVGDVGLWKGNIRFAVGGEVEFTLTFEVDGYAPTIVRLPNEAVEQILRRDADEVRVDVGKVIVTKGITLKVRVINAEDGLPIGDAGVLISLREVDPRLVELRMRINKQAQKKVLALGGQYFAKTDEDGWAVFEGVSVATWNIYAVADGYEPAHREVTMPLKERSVEMTIELKRKVELRKERTKRRAAEA